MSPVLMELPDGEELVTRKEQRTGKSMVISRAWWSHSLESAGFPLFQAGGGPAESQLTHKNGLLHFCWHVVCIWWSNIFIMKLDENPDAQTNRYQPTLFFGSQVTETATNREQSQRLPPPHRIPFSYPPVISPQMSLAHRGDGASLHYQPPQQRNVLYLGCC